MPFFRVHNVLYSFLFWLHAVAIAAAILLGFFVTPLWALALVAAHRLHVILLGECLLSKIQRRTGGMPHDKNFLQLLSKRLFQKEIGYRGSQILDYSLAGTMIAIALVR